MNIRYLLVLGTILALSGCGSTPPSVFYALDGSDAIEKISSFKKTGPVLIGIEPVSIPPYINRPQIVVRHPDNLTASVSEFHRWTEALSDSFPRILANAISERAGWMAARPINLKGEQVSYRLQVDVQRLDATFSDKKISKNDKVFLDTWWTITNDSGKIVYRTRSVLSAPIENSYDDAVRAEQQLVKDLGYTIADYVLKNLEKGKN